MSGDFVLNSWMGSGGAAATGAFKNEGSKRTRDTVKETAAESRRDAFIRLGADLKSCCRNPASPRYHAVVDRGDWRPAGIELAHVSASPAAIQYHSQSAGENQPTSASGRSQRATIELRSATRVSPRGRAAVLERQGETIVDPPQRHVTSGSKT